MPVGHTRAEILSPLSLQAFRLNCMSGQEETSSSTILCDLESYANTKATPWSEIITERRMKWLGHLSRLPEETPARQAFEIFQEPTKKPRGAQKNNIDQKC